MDEETEFTLPKMQPLTPERAAAMWRAVALALVVALLIVSIISARHWNMAAEAEAALAVCRRGVVPLW